MTPLTVVPDFDPTQDNRTSQTIGTQTTSFTLNSDDELTATASSTSGFVNSYSYNANGEQTGRTLSGTAYTLAYDYDGQLTSTSVGGSVQSSFAYDATGRRVSRTNGGTTTKFYYGAGKILVETQGGTTTAVYTYGNALIRKDGEIPLFDGQGNERIVTNANQTQINGVNFDGFGNTIGTFGSSTSSYMYGATSGYRTEGDAGLSQVGARYYDAQVGRFTSRDTYLDQKPYLYCDHDSINGTDPSGHYSFKVLVRLQFVWVSKELEPTPPSLPPACPPEYTPEGLPPPPSAVIPERPVGSCGGAGGIATVGIGVGVGAEGATKAIHWRRSIASYRDGNGDWAESGGF